jgi:hypothetical protein
MSKNTEWLSVTENLIYFLGKRHTIMKQEQVTWYSNDGTLPPKMLNRKFSLSFIFGDT